MSTTPLLCSLLMKQADSTEDNDPYSGRFFQAYRALVAAAVDYRKLTIGVTVALFLLSYYGFGHVKEGFFPASNTPLLLIDLYEPEGTDIRKTREDTLVLRNPPLPTAR